MPGAARRASCEYSAIMKGSEQRGGQFILIAGMTLYAIGQSLVFIIVAPLARSTGLTEFEFGLVFSIANLSLLIGAPFWGKKSDVIGRKPVFVIGLFGSAIGTTLVALSIQGAINGWYSTTWLIVLMISARAIYGLTVSGIYPAVVGYIADVTSVHTRSRGLARMGAANSLGSVLGPALGAGLASLGILFPMYAAASLAFLGGLWALFFLPEPAREPVKRKSSGLKITDPVLRPFIFIWICFFVVFISLQFITAFYIQDRFGITGQAAIVRTAGLALIIMSGVIIVLQSFVLQVWHIAPKILLRMCPPFFVIALIIMAWAPSISMLMAGFAVLGISFACASPGINGSASLCVEPRQQGAAAGYLSAANIVGVILGPIVGTALYRIQPNAPMIAGAVLLSLASLVAFSIKVPEH